MTFPNVPVPKTSCTSYCRFLEKDGGWGSIFSLIDRSIVYARVRGLRAVENREEETRSRKERRSSIKLRSMLRGTLSDDRTILWTQGERWRRCNTAGICSKPLQQRHRQHDWWAPVHPPVRTCELPGPRGILADLSEAIDKVMAATRSAIAQYTYTY
jgi:hypothetical protein